MLRKKNLHFTVQSNEFLQEEIYSFCAQIEYQNFYF